MFTAPPPATFSVECIALPQLAGLCWQGTATVRREAHQRHNRRYCPTRHAPYGDLDPTGRAVAEHCRQDECLDIHHDVLMAVHDRLTRRWADGDGPDNPARYITSTIATLLVDQRRARRVARGWPAKPGRMDGRAAVVNAHLRATAPDEVTGSWWIVLFRILRCYACTEGRTVAGWPVDGLIQEKARHLSVTVHDVSGQEILDDIAAVLAAADEAVGRQWVHQAIWHPLLSGLTHAEVPEDVLAPGGELEDQVLSNWFRDLYASFRREGATARQAFRAAAEVVGGAVPPPAASLLKELDDTISI